MPHFSSFILLGLCLRPSFAFLEVRFSFMDGSWAVLDSVRVFLLNLAFDDEYILLFFPFCLKCPMKTKLAIIRPNRRKGKKLKGSSRDVGVVVVVGVNGRETVTIMQFELLFPCSLKATTMK